MEKKQELLQRLRQLDVARQAVNIMEQALQVLTPEERLVVQMMIICPEENAVEKLCQLLCVECATVYRRREQALKKLQVALWGDDAQWDEP